MLFASVAESLFKMHSLASVGVKIADVLPVALFLCCVLCFSVRFLNFKIIASVTLFLKDNTDILKLLCEYVNVCALRELYTHSQTPVEEGAGLPRLRASLLVFLCSWTKVRVGG